MTYRGYTLRRCPPLPGATKPRKARYEVDDPDGKEVNLFTYTVGNHAGRLHALARAKTWIDDLLK